MKQLSDELQKKLQTLTKKERTYFKCMWPKSGVLYITSKPGVAKSAIMRSIANKMGFHYIDIRLAMVDETDVGLFPSLSDIDGIKCLEHVVPKWAHNANKRPTIIHFEEINRSTLQVRNAALQILLERAIGEDFKFNDNVLMVASGNLGEEDNTDVEEFDAALNGRLIHLKHVLSNDEWFEGYANDNIHPIIKKFIKANPEAIYKEAGENSKAYASPRSWTFLSDYIVANYGMNVSTREFLPDLVYLAHSYIGNTGKQFIDFCESDLKINILDILDRFDDVQYELMNNYQRDKRSQLIQSLKAISIDELSDMQRANATKFLRLLGEDELTDYILGLIDTPSKKVTESPVIKAFLRQFSDILEKTYNTNRKNFEK